MASGTTPKATPVRARRSAGSPAAGGRAAAKSEATLLDEKHAREFAAAHWSADDIDRLHDFDQSNLEIGTAIEKARAWHAEQRKMRAKRALSSDGRRTSKSQS